MNLKTAENVANVAATIAWTPAGAVRTAVKRMVKRGLSRDDVRKTLLAAAKDLNGATYNMGGAIKRCRKHGVSDAMIVTAIYTVASQFVDASSKPAPVTHVPAKTVAASVRKERTPAQVAADKARMARVRSFRKTAPVNRANSVPASKAPTSESPAKHLHGIPMRSFSELDRLLTELGF
jgi:hypothetical protein